VSDEPQPEFLQPPVRADGPIHLAEADPDWAEQYARQRERIQAALGSRAVQIEHVGSTSVPGLAAKPVIDIVRDHNPDVQVYVFTVGSEVLLGLARQATPSARSR
jgi:GrpB-like predicted nucleotidyltransferase (UPF0157 family)